MISKYAKVGCLYYRWKSHLISGVFPLVHTHTDRRGCLRSKFISVLQVTLC